MKSSIKKIFWLISLMFFLIIIWLGKLTIFDRDELITNPYNPRLQYSDTSIKRGNIKDINGEIIAESEYTENGYVRNYPRSRMAAHVTGYSSMGKTGVEAAENFELENIHNEVVQKISNAFKGTEVKGNDVVLTVDMEIQSLAGDLLGDQKGAIVVMEPSTGRIIAMQAYPDFNPNTVDENWNELKNSEESPLINRTTQGLYPPGSTFKIVTALAAMEYLDDWETFTVECTGEAEFEDKVIHCYNNKAHGTVDMHEAMAESCNCYFAEIGKRIGGENLRKVADRLMVNSSLGFELPSSQSSVVIDKNSSESELVETAIGQGKTVVTPIYMASLVSSVANGGIMKKPYIVDHIEYPNGKTSETIIPETIGEIMTYDEAKKLNDMMISVVNEGTGTAAALKGYQAAGKTGTAENSKGIDHSWFVGYAPADNPEVAVAVILENSGNNKKAAPIAGKLMQAVLDKNWN